jgi:ATP-dependent protease HslVU (ClpYQ) peptidase subunit
MTCIVGFLDKKNKKVVIGADSAGVAGLNITVRKDSKVFTVGDFVIGCTSSFKMIQLLRFSFKPPEVNKKDIYEYMCTDFITAVRECFKEGGFLQKDTEGDEKGGTFLVGYKDRLFQIEGDFQVGESLNGLNAVGCGEDFALGALYTGLKENLPAKERVLKALEAAAFFSAGVCKPFVIKET